MSLSKSKCTTWFAEEEIGRRRGVGLVLTKGILQQTVHDPFVWRGLYMMSARLLGNASKGLNSLAVESNLKLCECNDYGGERMHNTMATALREREQKPFQVG